MTFKERLRELMTGIEEKKQQGSTTLLANIANNSGGYLIVTNREVASLINQRHGVPKDKLITLNDSLRGKISAPIFIDNFTVIYLGQNILLDMEELEKRIETLQENTEKLEKENEELRLRAKNAEELLKKYIKGEH